MPLVCVPKPLNCVSRSYSRKYVANGVKRDMLTNAGLCMTDAFTGAGHFHKPATTHIIYHSECMLAQGPTCLVTMHLPHLLVQVLARKMVATFKLCSEQLSSQDHYDYGMRAVKSTITACGNLKASHPNDAEDVLVLRGLRDINVPKFLAPDLPLFHGIISDLFPGVAPPQADYEALYSALKVSCGDLKIQNTAEFVGKVVQLYETTVVRHGLMLVGPTMGGKTSNYRALASAMTHLAGIASFQKVRITALNPKAITMGQLYGEFDENTHEWTDGVLACYMRECSADTKADKKWIMFDGPVDAIWIENMNTVRVF
jgi:dynein heavy chain, axonemal